MCGKTHLVEWVYLSPHLDDVALSCGGLVWEQARRGQAVSVWTVCAGDPPPGPLSPYAESLHDRWETGRQAVGQRRREDKLSCRQMGAALCHLRIPDCIYRRAEEAGEPLYASEEAIFGPLHPVEQPLVLWLAGELRRLLSPHSRLVSPLTIGGHVDHRLTRAAAEKLGRPLWYYADYPYVGKDASLLDHLHQEGWVSMRFRVSEQGLQVWAESVVAHASQVGTFWPSAEDVRQALHAHRQSMGGVTLWHPPRS